MGVCSSHLHSMGHCMAVAAGKRPLPGHLVVTHFAFLETSVVLHFWAIMIHELPVGHLFAKELNCRSHRHASSSAASPDNLCGERGGLSPSGSCCLVLPACLGEGLPRTLGVCLETRTYKGARAKKEVSWDVLREASVEGGLLIKLTECSMSMKIITHQPHLQNPARRPTVIMMKHWAMVDMHLVSGPTAFHDG